MEKILSLWSTKRLRIADSIEAQITDLQKIYEACSYIGEWCSSDTSISGHEIEEEFHHRNLPPNGKSEHHRIQTIQNTSEDIIGYIILYHGFPDPKTLWIATLAIHPDQQKKQYGQEVIYGITSEVRSLDFYNSIGGSVGIKNWPALRFWIQSGFDHILKFEGDIEYSKNTFADLWLSKKL